MPLLVLIHRLSSTIAEDAAHSITRQPITVAVDRKATCLWIKSVQAILGAKPHGSRVIEIHAIYLRVAQGMRDQLRLWL